MIKIPYGISGFETIRKEGFKYVDKTSYIRNIETERYCMYVRLRRFGKTLFTTTLDAYYSIDKKDKFEELFKGLYIYDNPTEKKNSYYVLNFNFSGLLVNSQMNIKEIEEAFNAVVYTTVKFERVEWNNEYGLDASDCFETIPSKILTRVTTNGGFYIARFEAGIAENMPQEELNVDSSAIYGTGTYKPVSKQGVIVWNYIQWGDANDDTNSGNGAVTVARNMYPEEDTNYGVVSTLIYGTQWDAALKFIGAYNVGENGYDTYAIDSTGMGNYSGIGEGDPTSEEPAVSGSSETFRQKNIYDMAGNVYEWTMEKYNTDCVGRAGTYNDSGSERSASNRTYSSVDYDSSSLRLPLCTLYKIILNFKERKIN